MGCLCPKENFFNAVGDCVRKACEAEYGAEVEAKAEIAVAAAHAVCASK